MKDRIVAFLLFLGKIVIVCLVGKSLFFHTVLPAYTMYIHVHVCGESVCTYMYMYLLGALQVS